MSKGKKRIVRLTESEMVNLIERIVKTVKSEKETLRESTRRRVMKEANKPKSKQVVKESQQIGRNRKRK